MYGVMSQKVELFKGYIIQRITVPEQIFQAAHGDPVVGQEQLTMLSQQLQRVIQEHVEGLSEVLLLVSKVTCQRAEGRR